MLLYIVRIVSFDVIFFLYNLSRSVAVLKHEGHVWSEDGTGRGMTTLIGAPFNKDT